ncbi:unnamed protein product [Musa acuminata subsp. malaccensis]|uniref:(wild Malaysian banana) hypothetical protein n=1 Tax=Musa acuminata subsp. malaccensis TaxID=214687 RepID=A0A804JZH6_MUSAM|nr:unnamed protein product [Musa acuminata subsp. malaccensis]
MPKGFGAAHRADGDRPPQEALASLIRSKSGFGCGLLRYLKRISRVFKRFELAF